MSKKSLLWLIGIVLSFGIIAVCAAVLSFLCLKSGWGNSSSGICAVLSVFVGTFTGCVFIAKKTETPYAALILMGAVLGILLLVSMLTDKSEYALSFSNPSSCCLAGLLCFLFLSKPSASGRQKAKRMLKHVKH